MATGIKHYSGEITVDSLETISDIWDSRVDITTDLAYTIADQFSTSTEETVPQDVAFSTDGTKMFVTGQTNNSLVEYTLSTAWNPSTATHVDSTAFNAAAANPTGMVFNAAGTKVYVMKGTDEEVYPHTLSVAWDASTMTYDGAPLSLPISGVADGINIGRFAKSGTKFYTLSQTTDTIYEFDVHTAYDLSTAVYTTNSFATSTEETVPYGFDLSDDGSILLVVGNAGDGVDKYLLSTPWDISSASADSFIAFASIDSAAAPTPYCLTKGNNGAYLYVIDSNDDVERFTLDSALASNPYDSVYTVPASTAAQVVMNVKTTGAGRILAGDDILAEFTSGGTITFDGSKHTITNGNFYVGGAPAALGTAFPKFIFGAGDELKLDVDGSDDGVYYDFQIIEDAA